MLQFLDAQVLHPLEEALPPLPVPELLKLKAETSFSVSDELHSGQLTEIALEVTISSNSFPQPLQRNSKIGIFLPFF